MKPNISIYIKKVSEDRNDLVVKLDGGVKIGSFSDNMYDGVDESTISCLSTLVALQGAGIVNITATDSAISAWPILNHTPSVAPLESAGVQRRRIQADAIQYIGSNHADVGEFISGIPKADTVTITGGTDPSLAPGVSYFDHARGIIEVRDGQWVVRALGRILILDQEEFETEVRRLA